MSFIKEKNIGKISFIASVILVVLLTTILGAAFFYQKHSLFEKNLKRVENTYITLQKERLRSEITIEINRINDQRENAEQNLKKYIKQRVDEAHAIAMNVYRKNGGSGMATVRSLVREILLPFRYNDGRGYFFIFAAASGEFVLYPPDPSIEGSNEYWNLHQERKDLYGKMTQIIRDAGAGFIKYQWAKPGENTKVTFPKVTYVRHFEPYDWIVGTGEYLDNFEADIQKTIAVNLNDSVSGLQSPEYVFIYQLHDVNGGDEFATMLVNPNRPDLIGTKLSDAFKDAKGLMFRKEMLNGIRDKGDAFVTYWYKKPMAEGLFAKLSYFKYFPEWNWIVAKGIYLDDLDRRIADMQTDLRRETGKTIRFLACFLVITCSLFLVLAYMFSRGVSILFEGYKKIQKDNQDKLEQLNRVLEIQATTDPLTKIYNRAYFNARLDQEILRSGRYQSQLSLILFDIDHFKKVNDTFGHLAGDSILKDISSLCWKNIRSSDILARWGGEEFAILVPENKNEKASILAEKLRKIIAEHSFSIDSRVTCSFGVANYINGENKDAFINKADMALYAAKQAGRNKVVAD